MTAVCELILGMVSFAMNAMQFRGGLEAIEDTALDLQQLEEGHLVVEYVTCSPFFCAGSIIPEIE